MYGNLPGSTSNGQKDTNTVANSHQVVAAKGRPSDQRQVGKAKSHPKERYNAKSRPLTPLQPDQAIRMKLPGDTKWSLGSCVNALPNRSYEVEVAGRRYRRNRRQLRTTAEIPPSPSLEDDSSHHLPQTTRPRSASQKSDLIIDHDKPADVPSLPAVQLRRSSRSRKPPAWHNDYVMNT